MKGSMKMVQLALALLWLLPAAAQKKAAPRLVVGIVVDQMRWDYLYRYSNRYGPDGFKRLLGEGFSCENTFIPYTPTYTAAGHACVYTGSVPALHGIMGNNWYDEEQGKTVYCTDDASVQGVGTTSAAGRMSPRNLWSNTIADEIRLAANYRNKTIAVALKDRGSILPGGHSANGAYWFDNATGGFVSSTFYMQQLPAWVAQFNARRLPDTYLKQPWTPLYPIATYEQSTPDSRAYENSLPGEDNTFPHVIDTAAANRYEFFRHLPAANTYTLEMAKTAVVQEQLGQRGLTDVLTVSLSSPDYLGHATGPNSVEAEDMYLRLDADLAGFLKHLDATVGKGQYLLFLTADHGSANIPGFLQETRQPGGALDDAVLFGALNAALKKAYGLQDNLVLTMINYQVYLNDAAIAREKIDRRALKQQVIDSLLRYPGIARAFDLEAVQTVALPERLKHMIVNGYNQRLSGDIQFLYKPQWFDGGGRGTTHGAWNPYDAHIPLVWFGWKVPAGRLHRETRMTDIAPTVAALLQVQMPNASIGEVIHEIIR